MEESQRETGDVSDPTSADAGEKPAGASGESPVATGVNSEVEDAQIKRAGVYVQGLEISLQWSI
jgi:hypothetical protein